MIDLYKKNVWNDAKTVNVIAEACFSQNVKLVALAVHFFLGSSNDSQQANDDDDDNNNTPMDMRAMKHVMSITKKTKARKNQLDKAIAASKRVRRREILCTKMFSRISPTHFPPFCRRIAKMPTIKFSTSLPFNSSMIHKGFRRNCLFV